MGKFANSNLIMKKRLICFISVFCILGCSTINIPKYIKDEKPYKKVVYADFETALQATKEALNLSGWEVVSSSDPKVFEHSSLVDPNGKEIEVASFE